MYLKIILTSQSDERDEKNDETENKSDDSDDLNSSDNFSDIENKNFWKILSMILNYLILSSWT